MKKPSKKKILELKKTSRGSKLPPKSSSDEGGSTGVAINFRAPGS